MKILKIIAFCLMIIGVLIILWSGSYFIEGNVLMPNYKLSIKKRIHQLKVAGALIAAEIDILQNY